jgi:hypothetical protein
MTLARWLMTKPGQLAELLSTPSAGVPVPRTKKFKIHKDSLFAACAGLKQTFEFQAIV